MLLDTKLPNKRNGKIVEVRCDNCLRIRVVEWNNFIKSRKLAESKGKPVKDLCRTCNIREVTKAKKISPPAWVNLKHFPEVKEIQHTRLNLRY